MLGVEHVKERWMIPLLFVVPLYFFSRTGIGEIDGKRVRRYRRLAFSIAGVILIAAGTRALLGPKLGATTRVNYPFDQVASAMADGVPDSSSGIILTHSSWFAGNLLQRFPGSRAMVPGFFLPAPSEVSSILLVWDATKSDELPEEMATELRSRFGMAPENLVPEIIAPAYKFGAGRKARVAFLRLERGETQHNGESSSPRPR